jgi:hypothetical protein
MDARLETTTHEVVDRRLNLTMWHISRKPEDSTEDKGEVDNVASHKADILNTKKSLKLSIYYKSVLTCSCNDCSATQLLSLVYHLI